MRRAAVGDFDSMFAAEYAAVLRTVFLICHDTHLAQDITQEAFVELLRHWDKVSRYERPGAWVRRVAIRKLVKAMRRDVRRREAEVTFEPPTALSASSSPCSATRPRTCTSRVSTAPASGASPTPPPARRSPPTGNDQRVVCLR